MIKLLIISATSQSNLLLANSISNIIQNSKYKVKVLNIEEYELPLFNPSKVNLDKKNNMNSIKIITNEIVAANGVIICAPEYNGNVPPVLSNAIAWISVTTSYWKDGFKDKNYFIASSSGGDAENFQKSMQSQLEHLGGKVYEKKIIITSSNNKISEDSKNHLKDFLKLL